MTKKSLFTRTLAVILLVFAMLFSGCAPLGNTTPVNYPQIVNTVTLDKMHGNIKIIATAKKTFGPWVMDKQSWQGSGIIFADNDGYYYALTNNHVIFNDTNYSNFALTAIDYMGKEYSAEMVAAAASYDLALIKFRKSNNRLSVLTLRTTNPAVGEEIISIGQPLGQNNAITFGKVLGYEQITVGNATEEQSDVKFPALKHDAPTESGSSGGAILDLSLNICAIHYAGSKTDSGDYVAGYAIQAEKIVEFLNGTGLVTIEQSAA